MTGTQKYTITIYVAAPGTPLIEEGPGATSTPGHMFYVINDGAKKQSFGFAPIEHGSFYGPGKIVPNDVDNYKDPLYSRTMEITKEQYEKLKSFGESPKQFGFDEHYKDFRNNCVDFTWAALNQAGIQRPSYIDLTAGSLAPSVRIPLPGTSEGKGVFRPVENINDIKAIAPPIPGSPLNQEHTNPMPSRTPKQWLLTEHSLDNPAHEGHAIFQQALNGVGAVNAKHNVAPSERDKDFAGAIAVGATAHGLERIDHVLLSADGSKTFALQGNLDNHRELSKNMASLSTVEALNTPLAQSSAAWGQAVEQGQQVRDQAQSQQQNVERDRVQQPAPTMQV